MKTRLALLAVIILALDGLALALAPANKTATPRSDREKLIGTWHLVAMEEPSADGKMVRFEDRKGQLIYTRDGYMSVQVLYPPSASPISNDYVLNGYEASFGSYDVDEAAHIVTHHVQGSITPGLVGKNLRRVFHLTGNRLLIRSTQPDEHWSVTWERNDSGSRIGTPANP